jgi:ABC-type nitrate/sulfonate/bicarbonate transport system substrate-binding protein
MNLLHWTRLTAAVALLLCGSISGCSKRESTTNAGARTASEFETLELRYQGFVGTVTYPELAEDLGYLAPIKLKYVGNTISGPQDIQSVVTGDTDYGGAFNGAVLKLIAARAPVQAVIGYYGVDEETYSGSYVLADSPIHSPRDLIGKKVAVNTIGAHAEFVLRDYLARNGLTKAEAEQVTLIVLPPVVCEQALRQKQVDVATLTNMLRDKALERGNIRKLFSDFELFGKFTAGSYVLTKSFLRDKPKTARKFVEATAKAIEWARSHPREEVILRYQEMIKRRGRNEDPSPVRYWRTTGIAGKGGLISEREFTIWLDWLVNDGQLTAGQLKLGDVYTNQLNPFFGTGPT